MWIFLYWNYWFHVKNLSRSIVYSKFGHEYEKTFKEEEEQKIIGLVNNIEEYQKIYNHV